MTPLISTQDLLCNELKTHWCRILDYISQKILLFIKYLQEVIQICFELHLDFSYKRLSFLIRFFLHFVTKKSPSHFPSCFYSSGLLISSFGKLLLLLKVTIRLKQSGLNETHLDHINREKESGEKGKERKEWSEGERRRVSDMNKWRER